MKVRRAHGGRRPKASNEGTRVTLGRTAAAALWRFGCADVGVRKSAGLGDDVIVPAGLADRL